MIIKEIKDLDNSGKTRKFTICSCDICGAEYRRASRHLGETSTKFCSQRCKGMSSRIKSKCGHCNTEFYVEPSRAKASKSGIVFCSRKCKDLGQKYIQEIWPEHYFSSKEYRKLAFNKLPNHCNRCGFSVLEALEVHHIDRDRKNNLISNLEILCANCHTIEHKLNK